MPAPRWHEGERDGVRLACAEHPGLGPPVVLLHGLAGYAGEWEPTAAALAPAYRVLVPEQRGHGRSARRPADVSGSAFAADVAWWLERIAAAPAVVAGQSLGGQVALLVAARRPELVRGLVVAEATPGFDPAAPRAVQEWIERWPVPFPSREAAEAFFDRSPAWARAWAGGLEARDDGLWPAFDLDTLLAALVRVGSEASWEAWGRVRCPALVVHASAGDRADEIARMLEAQPQALAVAIEDAGHDLHLDQPARWKRTLETFLSALDAPAA
jgi:pimeloyl-ACP methyl ester carboxylesterase